MERRKDNKGRVLKEGESQRKDGSYQYRYSDRSGKRHYIYSVDLKDLRSRETSIQKARTLYGDVVNTTITMRDVINRYFEMHKGSLRSDTRINRESTIAKFKDDALDKKFILFRMVISNHKFISGCYSSCFRGCL